MSAWLQTHPENAATMQADINTNTNNISTLTTNVGTLTTNLGTVSGKVSALETTVQNLGDTYVTLTTFNNKVGDLTKLKATGETNVVDEILAIHEAMKWQEMN